MTVAKSKDMATPQLIDFAHSVPPPLNSIILTFAPHIAWLRWAVHVINWKKGHRQESWLLLAAWWITCMLGRYAVKYGLPFILFVPLLLPKTRQRVSLSTEDTFHNAINDLQAIQIYAQVAQVSLPPLHWQPTLRAVGTLLVPYFLLTHFVRTRVLVAIFGSIILTWRANWSRRLRSILWKSALLRRSLYQVWYILSGERVQGYPQRFEATAKSEIKPNAAGLTELRLLFTVVENQRWWMGLDWTAALLPSERPSWSTADLQPIAPPAAFSLPAPVTSFLSHPDNPEERIQRKATWRWDEPDWKVIVNRSDISSSVSSADIQRVAKPVPNASSSTIAGEKLTSKVSKLKEVVSDAKDGLENKIKSTGRHADSEHHERDEDASSSDGSSQDEPVTDADGWIYGDNKWENTSPRGGMGKYTRSRRWTRIAILREDVENAAPGKIGVVGPLQTEGDAAGSQDVARGNLQSVATHGSVASKSPTSPTSESATERLRQRLKAAVKSE